MSFLALILLTGKLYDVDREVSFLRFVSSEWIEDIPKDVNNSVRSNHKIQTAIFHIENLKQDIEILIGMLLLNYNNIIDCIQK